MSNASPPAPPGPLVKPTPERELLFMDWLTAFGKIEVADRAAFARELQAWLNRNVNEIAV